MDLDTEEEYAEGSNEFMLVNINGQGNKFTISYTTGGEDPDEEFEGLWGGAIISGEVSNNGIKNLQMASIIFGIPMLGLLTLYSIFMPIAMASVILQTGLNGPKMIGFNHPVMAWPSH